jgi:hypothetical protein
VFAGVLDGLLGVAAALVSKEAGDHCGELSRVASGITECITNTGVHSIASELEDKCSSSMLESSALSEVSAPGHTL